MERFDVNRHPDFCVLIHAGLDVMTYRCSSFRSDGRGGSRTEEAVGIAGVVESWGYDAHGPYAALRELKTEERRGLEEAVRASYSISNIIFR